MRFTEQPGAVPTLGPTDAQLLIVKVYDFNGCTGLMSGHTFSPISGSL